MDASLAKAQRWLIAAFVFFVVLAIFPLTPKPTDDVKILGYELCAFAALALWLFTPRLAKEAIPQSSALSPLLILFLCLNLAAASRAPSPGYSLAVECVKWTALLMLSIAAADAFHTPKQVWGLIAVLCVAVSVASIYGTAQYFGHDPFPWDDTSGMLRAAPATFGNPNFASHALTCAAILAAGLGAQRKGRWALLCLPLFLFHFSVTQTRGSVLALAGALTLVLVALLVSRWVKKPSWAIALTFGIVLAAGMFAIAAVAADIKMNTGQLYPGDRSVTFRYHSFDGACRMIQDRPWLGHGPGMYQVANPAYRTAMEKEVFRNSRTYNEHVHNEPLEIAVDAGLPAAIIYIAILILGMYYGLSLWFTPNHSERRYLGITLAAFFFAFLLDGLFGFNAHVPVSAVFLFVVTGATAGLWRERDTPSMRRKVQFGRFSIGWRLATLGCATIVPILGIGQFAAQFCQQRGHGAMYYKAYAAAAECFQEAASLAPYDWMHPYYRGEALMDMGSSEEAAACYSRTLDLNPNYQDAMFLAAETTLDVAAHASIIEGLPLIEKAAAYVQPATQFDPLCPEIHEIWGRAAVLRAQGLTGPNREKAPESVQEIWRKAEQHLAKAIECNSRYAYTMYLLTARARLAQDDPAGAQEALIHSLQDKPGEMETWQLFLEICRKTGQYEALRTSLDWCIERLERLRNTSDELGALYLLRAKVLYKGYGDESGAEDAFLRVTTKYPLRVDAWAGFHAFAKATGREALFGAHLLKTLAGPQNKGKDVPPLVRAVFLGLSQGEDGIVEGVSILVDELKRHQETAKNAEGTADLFSWAADALAARAQQGSLSPENAGNAFLNLGLVYGAWGDFNAAVQWLDRAAPSLSDEQLLLCLLRKGAALSNMGKTAAAVKAFEEAATEAPTSFEARYGLAQALDRDGQRAKARLEYLAILDNFDLSEEQRRTIQQAADALQP